MYSILHISDLHRTAGENISNAELISALRSDVKRHRFETPKIQAPEAIVVSGDLIQGVRLGERDSSSALKVQYRIALEFLGELTERFLDGDRSRLVLIPGNHDVDWVTARSAMSIVAPDKIPQKLARALQAHDTLYRWDWSQRQLLEISDKALYERRLDAYWDAFDEFYDGVNGLMDVRRGNSANLYSLHHGRIGVAAFNSCVSNDCFSFHGDISTEVIARAQLDLLDRGRFELLVAVWHHNIEGPPNRVDYMDVDIVRGMIGRGFRLGLFGHQHRPEAAPLQIQLASKETMAVVGAGSLCAGARERPAGAHRGYNVIELHDDLRSARIHFREMSVANVFGAARVAPFGGKSFADIGWETAADISEIGIQPRVNIQERLFGAEVHLRDGQYGQVIADLLPELESLPAYGRALLLKAARTHQELGVLRQVLSAPRTISEVVEYCDLLLADGLHENADSFLRQFAPIVQMTESHQRELWDRIEISKRIKS